MILPSNIKAGWIPHTDEGYKDTPRKVERHKDDTKPVTVIQNNLTEIVTITLPFYLTLENATLRC